MAFFIVLLRWKLLLMRQGDSAIRQAVGYRPCGPHIFVTLTNFASVAISAYCMTLAQLIQLSNVSPDPSGNPSEFSIIC